MKQTVAQAQAALDAAWDAHQTALDSGKQRAINKAGDAIVAATKALRVAQNHASMDAAQAGAK